MLDTLLQILFHRLCKIRNVLNLELRRPQASRLLGMLRFNLRNVCAALKVENKCVKRSSFHKFSPCFAFHASAIFSTLLVRARPANGFQSCPDNLVRIAEYNELAHATGKRP